MRLRLREQVYLCVSLPLHLGVSLPVSLHLVLQALVCPRLCILHLLFQLMDPGTQRQTHSVKKKNTLHAANTGPDGTVLFLDDVVTSSRNDYTYIIFYLYTIKTKHMEDISHANM